jgi:hypothetical protein
MTLGSARAVLEAAEVPPLILISSQSPPWGRRASHHWNLTRAISRKAITERSWELHYQQKKITLGVNTNTLAA